MLRILPREEKFFELFGDQATVLHEAAQVLIEMIKAPHQDPEERANEISKIEHRGDTIIHNIVTRLDQTFITPLDREDIHALSSRLDDMLDLIEDTAIRMVLYRVRDTRQPAIEIARIILRCAAEIKEAVPHILDKRQKLLGHSQEINRLEHECDTISRNAIAQLFDDERDPITLIKWKEIYEMLESTVDKAEDIANILESIMLKSA